MKPGYGVCPVCKGTTREAYDGAYPEYTYGYDPATKTIPCSNCGGQTMSLKATGEARLRADGTPCVHEFVGREAGRCYTEYHCTLCFETYAIDSSD